MFGIQLFETLLCYWCYHGPPSLCLSLSLSLCVCVCARACVCVYVCVCYIHTSIQTGLYNLSYSPSVLPGRSPNAFFFINNIRGKHAAIYYSSIRKPFVDVGESV